MRHPGWQKHVCQTLSYGKILWTVLQTVTPYPLYPLYPLPPKLPWRSCTHTVSTLLQTLSDLKCCSRMLGETQQIACRVVRQTLMIRLILLSLNLQPESAATYSVSPPTQYYRACILSMALSQHGCCAQEIGMTVTVQETGLFAYRAQDRLCTPSSLGGHCRPCP